MQYDEKFISKKKKKSLWVVVVVVVFMIAHSKALLRYFAGPSASIVLGTDFFCVLLWLIPYISLYFLYNINISGIGWQIKLAFKFR